MRFYTNRSHAWPATPVRNAKGLVQVQVTYVPANITRANKTHHGVHVGAIDIHLPTELVGDVADFRHCLFKDSMSGWVSNHAGGKTVASGLSLSAEIGYINIAIGSRPHNNNVQTHHLC